MLEQPVPEGRHPVGGTHAGVVHEELQPVGRTHIGEVHGGLSSAGGSPCWSREGCEEEGAGERTCDELTVTPIPCSSSSGEEAEKSGIKVSLIRRKGWGRAGVFF